MQRWVPAPPLEKVVLRDVKAAMRALGVYCSDLTQPRHTMQTEGLPDLLCLHPGWGLHWAFEVKRPKLGRVSPAQAAWHAVAERSGLRCFVVCGVADALAALEAMGAPIMGAER